MQNRIHRPVRLAGTLVVALVLSGNLVMAGGGPENVALVVNQDSWSSLTVANTYIQLRQIPPRNVIYLSSPVLARNRITIDAFRNEILVPVMGEIQRRGLEPQIDYVVYSADFPYSIDVRSDVAGDPRGSSLPRWMRGNASINGLTYLYQAVLEKNWRTYLGLRSNMYVQAPGQGFRASYGWTTAGGSSTPFGQRYVLSMMLAVTSGRGNSVDEVSSYLGRAASADSTNPSGTIYIMKNNNIRSKVREWAFNRTVRELDRIGVAGRINNGRIPIDRRDVMGAVIGTAKFDWQSSRSSILPGAICEHLTSHGGNLRPGASQTPLTEFLRHGAAGSSGTVSEPYAIQAKFPTALLHVAYASGCSLAESFYQSVSGPYQLLIVGDPLCQPWADRPRVSIEGIEAGDVVSGNIMIRAAAISEHPIRHIEVFLDGQRRAIYPSGSLIPLETTQLWNGPHELRLVAVAADAPQTQGRVIVPFAVDNSINQEPRPIIPAPRPIRPEPRPSGVTRPTPSLLFRSRVKQNKVKYGEAIELDAAIPGAEWIGVFKGTRLVGRLPGDSGTTKVSTDKLGVGETNLRLVAHVKDKPVRAEELRVHVQLPAFSPLVKPPGIRQRQPGWVLKTKQKTQVVQGADRIVGKLHNRSPFTFGAMFEIKSAGIYQLQLQPTEHVTRVRLNEQGISFNRKAYASIIPMRLDKGWYKLQIAGHISNNALPGIRVAQGDVAVQWFWLREMSKESSSLTLPR